MRHYIAQHFSIDMLSVVSKHNVQQLNQLKLVFARSNNDQNEGKNHEFRVAITILACDQ
jgi:hypothetical protein